MPALNVVRFRVKPGRDEDFLNAHRNMKEGFSGMRRAWLIKTGDRTYCMVGVWNELKNMVDARPSMIANLDKVRDCLEDMGGGLGVTDPVSGEVVVEMRGGGKPGGKTGGKAGGGAAGAATPEVSAKRAERKAKKKLERQAARRAGKGGGGGGGKKKEKK